VADPEADERGQEAGRRPVGLRSVAAGRVEAWRRREKKLDLERPNPEDPLNLELALVWTGSGDVELDQSTSLVSRALSQSLISPPCSSRRHRPPDMAHAREQLPFHLSVPLSPHRGHARRWRKGREGRGGKNIKPISSLRGGSFVNTLKTKGNFGPMYI
jgi:hypothetical protein